MKKELIVKNFGPVKDAIIEIKKYNVFVGHQSSGKSVIAKLISIFSDFSQIPYLPEDKDEYFRNQLKGYNINFEIKKDTFISYSEDSEDSEDTFLIEFSNGILSVKLDKERIRRKKYFDSIFDLVKGSSNIDINELDINELLEGTNLINRDKTIYIPAERSYFTLIKENIFTLLDIKSGLPIPRCITRFGRLYEELRQSTKNIKINFLGIEVSFSDNGDKLTISKEKETINLSMGSSGVQSVVPLFLVFDGVIKDNKSCSLFIIEEPELNLFPDAQVDLINNIISKIENSNNSIIVTTHSPYIISAIDNLVMAGNIISNNPDKKIKIDEIMNKIGSPIKFKDVSSYFFDKNGKVTNVSDKKNELLGAYCLDKASDYTANIFDQLLRYM